MIGGLGDGEAVAGWQMVELGSCCDLYQPSTLSKKELDPAGDIPVYGANGIIGFHSAYNHEEPEVLLACRGNVGTVNVSTGPAWINGNAMVCRPRDLSLSKPYLAYALQAVDLGPAISGTAQLQITRKSLSPIQIPICDTYEQGVIVRILDTQLARLDAVLSAVQAVRDRADQLRRSLLHAAFTGQLTQPDPSRGEAVPADWPVMTLDEINNSDRPICYGILKPGPDIEGGIPYVKVKHIRNRTVAVSDLQRTTPEIEQGFKRSRLEPGDLLITIRGTYGRTAIVPPSLPRGNITQDTARVHAVGADPRYVQNYVESPQGVGFLNSVAKGVAVRGVNIRDLRQMPVPVPPDIEQAEIVGILDTQLARLEQSLSVADRVEAECGRLRRSLLHAAFTGELTKTWREAHG